MIRFILLACAVTGQQYYAPGLLVESDLPYAVDPEQFASVPKFSELQKEQFERELAIANDGEEATVFEEELRIPGEKPKTNDSYLCTAFKQRSTKQKSIGKF